MRDMSEAASAPPSAPPTPRGLSYATDVDPGIRRMAHGYRLPDGSPVKDKATLARIAALVIPPALTDVWISPVANGHLQATGRDARGRKQYRYHDEWRSFRDQHKYGRLLEFGHALPRLRRQVEVDLERPGLPREKVLAAIVKLLELTLIRVGNDEYAKANKSFGLTTLRKRHLTLRTTGAVFEFRGKSGVLHKMGFADRRLARLLAHCQDLPGQRLFQFVDEAGARHPIESTDVNAYIRAAMGEDFSAKDFRTWAGALLAARALCLAPGDLTGCVKAVAALLGNTPAVCKACYIHPAVFEAKELSKDFCHEGRKAELALMRLLKAARLSKKPSGARR